MEEIAKIQLGEELEQAGKDIQISPQMLLLEEMRITPEKKLPKMDFLFQLFGMPCFPRRELVAITGKAKSGKTFVTSMLMACWRRALVPSRTGVTVACAVVRHRAERRIDAGHPEEPHREDGCGQRRGDTDRTVRE